MSKESKELPNYWELKLDETIINLQECQKNNSLNSCFPCDKFFDCDLRSNYVNRVYESMNKGSNGGFEF